MIGNRIAIEIEKEFSFTTAMLLVIFIVQFPIIVFLLSTTYAAGHSLHSYQIENRSTNTERRKQPSFFLNCLELISVHNSLVFLSCILISRQVGIFHVYYQVKFERWWINEMNYRNECHPVLKKRKRRRHWDVENLKHVYAHCVWKF